MIDYETGILRSLKYENQIDQVILVDFSWLLYRSYYAYGNFSCEIQGHKHLTGDIFGVFKTIISLTARYPCSAIVLCLDDRSMPGWRKHLCPHYKADREEKPFVWDKFEQIMKSVCLLPNVFIARGNGYEADDIIATLSITIDQNLPMIPEIFIFASDRDFYQLHSFKVKQFTKFEGKQPVFVNYRTEFNVAVNAVPLFRAFTGDSSDNVPGYPRIPVDLVSLLSEECLTPENVLAVNPEEFCMRHSLPKSRITWIKKVQQEPTILINNYKIMKLFAYPGVMICRVQPTWEYIEKYQMAGTKAKIEEILKMVVK